MAAWHEIRSCWHLTFPPGLGRREAVINSRRLAVRWGPSSAMKRCSQSWITELHRGYCGSGAKEKKKKKEHCVFCMYYIFCPQLPGLKMTLPPGPPERPRLVLRWQSKALPWTCTACVTGLSSMSLLLQPSTGGGRLIGGVGGAGEALKGPRRG